MWDEGTRGQGDKGTRGRGDEGTRGQGEWEDKFSIGSKQDALTTLFTTYNS